METPTPFIALETRLPENQKKLKKALADLKKLDKAAARLEQNAAQFSNENYFCVFPREIPYHLRQLRAILAGWSDSLQAYLTRPQINHPTPVPARGVVKAWTCAKPQLTKVCKINLQRFQAACPAWQRS